MQRGTLTGQRLVAVFLIGLVLFNYPVLSLFDRAAIFFGMPLVFAYLFMAWAGLIVLMIWVVEHNPERSDRGERSERSGG